MAIRCGFFVKDGKLWRKDVDIKWDLGFNKSAKHEYIDRIIEALGPEFQNAVDVTTASYNPEARCLSPIFVPAPDGRSVEESWANVKEVNPVLKHCAGGFDFLYLNCLSEKQREYVLRQTCFIDVFFNPEKGYNSQAKSLAMYQLLVQQDNLHLLKDYNEFRQWYYKYVNNTTVIWE